MTPPPPPPPGSAASYTEADGITEDSEPSSPSETLDLILHCLLPSLLAAALSARSLVGRWRLLHSKLSLLQSSLTAASASPGWASNTLFLHLLPAVLPTLHSVRSLAVRCQDPDLPSGKLRFQSDLDVAASAVSLHLHDLSLLLRSGLLDRTCQGRGQLDAAAVVLPLPGPSASRPDVVLFIRDIFARLQIGDLDLKHAALDSLLDLLASDPPKLARLVAEEGDLSLLLRVLDSSTAHSLLRDRVAAAISILATASDASRHAVFEEGALGPLLRLLDSGSAAVREKAAVAINAISGDPASAWAVSAYGGVAILVSACRSGSGSPTVQALAAGSLKNISVIDDIRAAMVEEGAIPALVDLLLSDNLDAQKNGTLCLCSLAATRSDEIRAAILHESGLQRLLQLLREASDSEAVEYILRAIQALSVSPAAARYLSSSPPFFYHLADLIKHGGGGSGITGIQETAASLIANLTPGEDIKRSMSSAITALLKMMEFSKPASTQEAAARALVSLLASRSNRKELTKDENIKRLVQMLDPANEADKRPPISVVMALLSGGGGGTRKRLAEAGTCQSLQKLTDADVPGAKKALQKIGGGRLKNLFSIGWT